MQRFRWALATPLWLAAGITDAALPALVEGSAALDRSLPRRASGGRR